MIAIERSNLCLATSMDRLNVATFASMTATKSDNLSGRILTGAGMKLWTIAIGLCGLLGCSGLTTQPQQPNYTLVNVDAQCVRTAMLNSLVDQGFTIRSATDNQIVAGRPALGGGLAGALAPTNERRVTILFIPQPDSGMRVVVTESLVDNAGSGFERNTPVYPGNGIYSMTGQGTQQQCARR